MFAKGPSGKLWSSPTAKTGTAVTMQAIKDYRKSEPMALGPSRNKVWIDSLDQKKSGSLGSRSRPDWPQAVVVGMCNAVFASIYPAIRRRRRALSFGILRERSKVQVVIGISPWRHFYWIWRQSLIFVAEERGEAEWVMSQQEVNYDSFFWGYGYETGLIVVLSRRYERRGFCSGGD